MYLWKIALIRFVRIHPHYFSSFLHRRRRVVSTKIHTREWTAWMANNVAKNGRRAHRRLLNGIRFSYLENCVRSTRSREMFAEVHHKAIHEFVQWFGNTMALENSKLSSQSLADNAEKRRFVLRSVSPLLRNNGNNLFQYGTRINAPHK